MTQGFAKCIVANPVLILMPASVIIRALAVLFRDPAAVGERLDSEPAFEPGFSSSAKVACSLLRHALIRYIVVVIVNPAFGPSVSFRHSGLFIG